MWEGRLCFAAERSSRTKKWHQSNLFFFSPHCFHIIVCSPDLVLKNYIRAIIDCWPRSDEYHWWQSHFQITCIAFKSFFVFSWYFDSLSLYFDCWHIGIWSKWFNAQNIEHCGAQCAMCTVHRNGTTNPRSVATFVPSQPFLAFPDESRRQLFTYPL